MKKFIFLLAAGIIAVNISKAQTQDPDTTARHFIIMASIGNLQEISSGQLAVQKASYGDVKNFGKMMVTDHSDGEAKLMQLARSKGFQIPPEATEKPVPDLKMSKAEGSDFDRMYIHAMVSGHRNTVYMFENYSIAGKDPDVKAFAKQMLPTLKEHLATIKGIDEKYNYVGFIIFKPRFKHKRTCEKLKCGFYL